MKDHTFSKHFLSYVWHEDINQKNTIATIAVSQFWTALNIKRLDGQSKWFSYLMIHTIISRNTWMHVSVVKANQCFFLSLVLSVHCRIMSLNVLLILCSFCDISINTILHGILKFFKKLMYFLYLLPQVYLVLILHRGSD